MWAEFVQNKLFKRFDWPTGRSSPPPLTALSWLTAPTSRDHGGEDADGKVARKESGSKGMRKRETKEEKMEKSGSEMNESSDEGRRPPVHLYEASSQINT